MREILFRGKVLNNAEYRANEWIQGIFIPHSKNYGYIILPYADDSGEYCKDYFYPVDINTVGQFTGLYDKNSKKIFEGDIVKEKGRFDDLIYLIEWHPDCARFALSYGKNEGYSTRELFYENDFEVVGNIHEHSFLLEEKNE